MRDETVASLEEQLAEARLKWKEAEDHGAEIARRAEAKIGELQEALNESGECEDDHECRSCYFLIMILAHLLTFLGLTISIYITRDHDSEHPSGDVGLVAGSFVPTLLFWSNWAWRKFKRRFSWNAWNDNDFFNAVAKWLH